jgi:hypothetical protein
VFGTYGFGNLEKDRFNLLVTVNYQKEKGMRGADRSFARSSILPEYNQDASSGNTFPANVVDADTGGDLVSGNPSYPGCPGRSCRCCPRPSAPGCSRRAASA